jgi:CRP/FNR family transcriptional regulator, cyclic AMP receptor protein
MYTEEVMNIKKILKYVEKRTEGLSDWAAHAFGTPWFLIVHVAVFSLWIILEIEPFPFGLLTMIVSLESILLSGLLLSATDRESQRDRSIMNRDLRVSKEIKELLIHMHDELAEVKKVVLEKDKRGGH